MLRQLKREKIIMSGKKHRNLMFMHKSFESSRNYYLVLDLCEEGDLHNFMRKNKIKFFEEGEAIRIMKEIISGLKELRSRNVIHRDLKLENIFIRNKSIVLGDFGSSKVVKEMTSTTVGTPLNMAPEVLAGNDYNNKSDLWSIGMVFYELLTGKPPFFALSMGELKNKILLKSGQNLNLKKFSHFCNETKLLLKKILEPDPNKRISWEEFFNHKIFSKEHCTLCSNFKNSKKSYLFDSSKKFLKEQSCKIKFVFLILKLFII
jgi:serine/threonine-protein kinase ULK/ATG1